MISMPLAEGWLVREAGGERWYPAAVPGHVHLDLMRAGVLDDPFAGDRESRAQWVGERDWEYRLRFPASPGVLACARARLVCEGLDTYATVRLNGHVVLEADNMFRPWAADVRPLLRSADNELTILFRSPLKEVGPRLQDAPYRLPCPNDQAGGTSPYTRKAQYHYGWDWGPCLVTCGPWRGIRLEAWSGARLEDVQVAQRELGSERAELDVTVAWEADQPAAATVQVFVDDQLAARAALDLAPGAAYARLPVAIARPRLWWPAGCGEQALYRVRVEWAVGSDVQRIERQIGLRTLEIRREPDADGAGFAVVVNGVPVFAKGANWIPADSFPARVSEARYRELLSGARDAHFNMLRVWGGGCYEQETFYDLCDELGLLVWQDFMFACALYPGDDAFVASVRAEAEHQVRRLRHRACLALWCGNNEVEWGWFSWGWKDTFPATVFADYRRLFDDVLPGVCRRLDPERLYWPSSPASDIRTSGDPNAAGRGDMHYWEVWGDPRATPDYYRRQRPRFASEFGFQSFPEPRTVASFASPGERAPDGPVMLVHQKATQGNDKIRQQVARMFGAARDHDAFGWLSQLVQAEYIRTALEHFRALRPHCMGALYWQINDCWPAASWSSIDYFGRWKALHYAVRRAFAPLLVTLQVDGSHVRARVVSDLREPLDAMLDVRLLAAGGAVLAQREVAVHAPPLSVTDAGALEVDGALGPGMRPCVVVHARLMGSSGALADQRAFLEEPGALRLPDPGLAVTVMESGHETVAEVSARRLAPVVRLDAVGEGRWEDNFFCLLAGETRRIRFLPAAPGGSPGRVTLQSLSDWVTPCDGS